jgi:hypothetical protein
MFACSCKKNNGDSSTAKKSEFLFTAIYDSTITMHANSNFNFAFSIQVASGDITQNKLTCSITNLPVSVAVSPSTIVVGSLKSGVFSINIGNRPIGTDTLLFNVNSDKYGLQVHKLLLKVVPLPDNAPLLAGTYTGSFDYCAPVDSFYHYTSGITTVPDTLNLIKIINLRNMGSGVVVRAWVNDGVTIPVQAAGPFTVWGTGSFIHDSAAIYHLIVNDTLVQGLDTQTCTVHIQH